MQTEPTCYVVDEDVSTQDALRNLANTLNLRCATYASGLEFLDAVDRSSTGCLVTELKMMSINGMQLLRRLVSEGVPLPVIILTKHADVPIAAKAIQAGAFHLFEKPFRERKLWDAIQEAVQVSRYWAKTAWRQWEIESRIRSLTEKERQMLEYLAQDKPCKAIAAEFDVTVRTVEIRRAKLMKKFDIDSKPAFARFAVLATANHNGNGGGVKKPALPR